MSQAAQETSCKRLREPPAKRAVERRLTAYRKRIPLRGIRVGPNRGTSGRQRALFVDQLLAQDVCVPAVLCKFAQHVQVHPAQR